MPSVWRPMRSGHNLVTMQSTSRAHNRAFPSSSPENYGSIDSSLQRRGPGDTLHRQRVPQSRRVAELVGDAVAMSHRVDGSVPGCSSRGAEPRLAVPGIVAEIQVGGAMESAASQAPARSAHRRQCDRRTRRTAGTARLIHPSYLLAGPLRAETLRRPLTTHDHTEAGAALWRVSWGRVGQVALRCVRPRPRVGRVQCRPRGSAGRAELCISGSGVAAQTIPHASRAARVPG